NKLDLTPVARAPLSQPFPTVNVSALLGAGFEALEAAIIKLADSYQTEVGDEWVAINARHAHALARAKECLDAAKAKLIGNEASELLASDLRGALDAFGEIAGKVDNERMLDQLFSTFCIGK